MNSIITSQKKLGYLVIFLITISLVLPVGIVTNLNNSSSSVNLPREYVSLSAVPSLNFTYYSLSDTTKRPVTSNSILAGDHVMLRAEWNESIVDRSRLEVQAPAIPATLVEDEDTYVTEIDTRYLGNNATCIINATAWFSNGSIFQQTFENVYIGNFFVPSVSIISPNGNENWTGVHNITWTASDVNSDDVLRFDVFLSSNGGISFDTLATSISTTWYQWDTSGLDRLDTYLVRVRVTDGIYFSSDSSNANFTAGDVITTTTTTTTTTTGTTTTLIEPRLAAFIIILLMSSSIMAIVVYYAARKWF